MGPTTTPVPGKYQTIKSHLSHMTKWPSTFPSTRFYLLRCEKLKMCKFVPKKLIFPDQRCTKMQSNTSVSVKSLVSALTSDQMQLWYAFGFFTQYQQLAQHIDRNRSWMPFQRDSEFSQKSKSIFYRLCL